MASVFFNARRSENVRHSEHPSIELVKILLPKTSLRVQLPGASVRDGIVRIPRVVNDCSERVAHEHMRERTWPWQKEGTTSLRWGAMANILRVPLPKATELDALESWGVF